MKIFIPDLIFGAIEINLKVLENRSLNEIHATPPQINSQTQATPSIRRSHFRLVFTPQVSFHFTWGYSYCTPAGCGLQLLHTHHSKIQIAHRSSVHRWFVNRDTKCGIRSTQNEI